jgi:ribosomal protein S18 acetylase RimI-like enzyme
MKPVRWWSELTRDMAEAVVAVPPPTDVIVRALGPDYDRARWDEPLRAAHNSAFADHWGSNPVSAAAWAHFRTGSRAFRPACSAAALTGDGEVVGYVMSYEYEADTAHIGRRDLYIGTVGTIAAQRGRGIASALLAHVLKSARGLGYDTASLSVDSQNPTGALGVYARAGFRQHRREVTYVLPAPG